MPERFLEKRDRNGRVEIPDMLRDERFIVTRDRDRCLELSAERDNAGKLARQLDRRRREAAGAAHEGRCSGHDAHHAVVGAGHDRPIVVDNRIGNATESATRIGSIDDDRFAGKIGRSRNQRQVGAFTHPIESARAAEQLPDHQPMQRRIG